MIENLPRFATFEQWARDHRFDADRSTIRPGRGLASAHLHIYLHEAFDDAPTGDFILVDVVNGVAGSVAMDFGHGRFCGGATGTLVLQPPDQLIRYSGTGPYELRLIRASWRGGPPTYRRGDGKAY